MAALGFSSASNPTGIVDNVIKGVVLAFTNISKRVTDETAVQLARELAENVADDIRKPLLVLDSQLQVVTANQPLLLPLFQGDAYRHGGTQNL